MTKIKKYANIINGGSYIFRGDNPLKKPYSLDYSIDRDTDRVIAITDILDKLPTTPPANELELMANYILFGKDEEGYNAPQRGEIILGQTRYNSYRRKDDKLLSLDAILENPLTDQQQLQDAHKKSPYPKHKPSIARPKYDKKTGEMIDPGDSDIPGMTELWQSIDRIERWIAVLDGKIAPAENDLLFDDSYRLYRLRHSLIDLRRHQYYLKDCYKPTLHFLAIDHPKPQFIDWTGDAAYWITYEEWQRRTSTALLHTVSRDIADYETRTNPLTNQLEVHWIVRRHTFNWEDPAHVRALINNYDSLYDYVYDKLDTYSRTLIFDFERYREMANFTEVRNFLLDKKIAHTPYEQILQELQEKFGLRYNENHLSTILVKEIPQRIAATAQKYRLILETPEEEKKQCYHCGAKLPRTTLFFARNRSRKDGFSSSCKECERLMRIARGGQGQHDKRSKEATLYKM